MIDRKSIEHIAKLARLYITDEEAQQYGDQLQKVITHFEKVAQINTTGIEPLVTPTDIPSLWREDKVSQEFSAEEMVANAPQKTGNLFTVPPVV
jgi:aspartyl-tRNA(Asn)/glutamyl-tRNA(Gln) amidotransferase subunit C